MESHGKRNGGKIIVTAHCDFVWKAARVKLLRKHRRRFYFGNLDNLVCVAEVFRSVMPRVRDRRMRFYFTTGEETTMDGAKRVMKREGRALYIPIDVTNASKTKDVNVEWTHNVDRKALRRALEKIPKIRLGFRNGHHDETMVYGTKFPTFSLNLPIEGHVHGRASVSFWKARRFGRAVAAILKQVRRHYDEICLVEQKNGKHNGKAAKNGKNGRHAAAA